jgi:hypothetical protein
MDNTLRAIGNIGRSVSGTPMRREAIICQKVTLSIPTISTSMLIIIANRVPADVKMLRIALEYPMIISFHDFPLAALRFARPIVVSVEHLYSIINFVVITTNALIYSTRIAGINVIRATSIEEIGAKRAERLPHIITHEYICVIFSFGASSTSRQSHETVVTFIIPLNRAATAKNQNPWLDAHIKHGKLHAKKSKTNVLSRRPSLSTIMPDRNAQTICENIYIDATIPTCMSPIPNDSI